MTKHIYRFRYVDMKTSADILKSVGDEQRLRILMLLAVKELSVCQLMGIMDLAQPLVSRNLSILSRAGFLSERRDGKLKFFRVREDLSPRLERLLAALKNMVEGDPQYLDDLETLRECDRFQKEAGRCDMKTFYEFQQWRRRKQ